MTIEELQALASRWGGDISRWPPTVRDAARALERTAEGRRVLEAERRLDALLARRPAISATRTHRATLGVLNRLADLESTTTRPGLLAQWMREWLVPTASLACSSVLGVALALGATALGPPASPDVAAINLILDSTSMLGGLETR